MSDVAASENTEVQANWFYTEGGERKGPILADAIHNLVANQTIDGDTPVWRKGWTDWKPLRETELMAGLGEEPPPVSATQINNGLVWVLAIAPLVYLFIDVFIRSYQVSRPWEDHSTLNALVWIIPAVSNAILCLLDENQLKKAGYAAGWITLFAVILAPAYLFLRAQRLKQKPTYGYVWIACFIASIVLQSA